MNVRAGPTFLIAMLVTGLLAGCGSNGSRTGTETRAAARTAAASPPSPRRAPGAGSGEQTIPTPAPTRIPANPAAVSVIRSWSDALRRGDVRGAAQFFALPSKFINGPDSAGGAVVSTIRTRLMAAAVNASLPCGARLISTDQRGRYVNALFRLTNRPGQGGGCGSGSGQTARTNFVIVAGRIAEWIRAPDDPGDNAGQQPQEPAPPPPTSPSPPSGSTPAV